MGKDYPMAEGSLDGTHPRVKKKESHNRPGTILPSQKSMDQVVRESQLRVMAGMESDANAESTVPQENPQAHTERPVSDYRAGQLRKAVVELYKRRLQPLNLYAPLEHVKPFHEHRTPERVLRGSNRSGKAQPIDEPVLTPDGWSPIGDLSVGDVVIGGDGKPCIVTGVFPQGRKSVYRVSFGDGAWTRCCKEHLWKIMLPKDRFSRNGSENWSVVSLGQIIEVCGMEPVGRRRPLIPVCIPWMPTRSTPIDPYVVGILLGDGSLRTSPSFSTADEEIKVAIESTLPEGYSLRHAKHAGKISYDYWVTSGKQNGAGPNKFAELCKHIGIWGHLAHEKRVPDNYLFNTAGNRLKLLQGLMDSDGTISRPTEKKRGTAVSFASTSKHLVEAVVSLVRSLGGRASVGSWRNKSYWSGTRKLKGRPSANVFIRMTTHCPFSLSRKREPWEEWNETAKRTPRVLRKIEPDGEAECVCIEVSSPDHTYVTRDFIVTHNTLAAAIEVARALTGQDPYGKYPKREGRAFLIGKDALRERTTH